MKKSPLIVKLRGFNSKRLTLRVSAFNLVRCEVTVDSESNYNITPLSIVNFNPLPTIPVGLAMPCRMISYSFCHKRANTAYWPAGILEPCRIKGQPSTYIGDIPCMERAVEVSKIN